MSKCESKRSYVLEVPDVDFIRPHGVVVFALFYCRLDLCCGECYVGCLQFACILFESYCVFFWGCVFLLANPCIVFQRVCVLCL